MPNASDVETQPVAEKLMTAEQAAQLSTVNRQFELVKGVYIPMSPAGGLHGVIAHNIGSILGNYVREKKLGRVTAAETGFILERDRKSVV